MRLNSPLPLFIALTLLLSPQIPGLRRADNSDWFSDTRALDSDITVRIQEKGVADTNFQIAGVTLQDGLFTTAAEQLGKTALVARGNAADLRYQACYVSQASDPAIHLVFEQGETNFAFYLFEGGAAWQGMDACAATDRLTAALATAAGIHLGQSESEIIAALGEPATRHENEMVYAFHVRKKLPPAELERLRPKYPQLSEPEFESNFGSYDLNASFRAKFSNAKLTFFSADVSQSN